MIEIDSLVGRYHIIEQLGEGGMATVYKAYETRLEREVAIKVIRSSAFSPEIFDRILKRFDREAKSLARLTHPNIVAIIDYGEYDNSPYLVMPYLPGGTIKQFLGKPMAYERTIELLLPIADALHYSHQKGIVHRDVKPANILITEGGQPMLADFGIARLLENEDTQTLTGSDVGVGTPAYMSPEQGIGKEVDGRSDIYSLGVVLYELVTGRKPYTADSPNAILLKQATEPLPKPRNFVPALPERVEQVIIKALAKKPEDRYQSMGDFARALSTVISRTSASAVEVVNSLPTFPTMEMPVNEDETGQTTFDLRIGTTTIARKAKSAMVPASAPVPSMARKPVVPPVEEKIPFVTDQGKKLRGDSYSEKSHSPRKKRQSAQPRPVRKVWLKWTLAAIGVVIIGAIIWGVSSSMTPAGIPASGTAETLPTQTLTFLLNVLPTQTLTPLPEVAPTQTPASAFMIDAQGNSVMRLGDGTLSQIVFSPDGKTIAEASSIGIYLYDADTLEQIRFIETGNFINSVSFSLDGRKLASGSNDDTIELWDAESGVLLNTLEGHSSGVTSVAYSPDGRTLASGSRDYTVKLWDAESDALLNTLEGHSSAVTSVAYSLDGRVLASGSYDGSIKLWDANTGTLLQTLEKPYNYNNGILSVAFSPDGLRLASGEVNCTIKLWDAERGALLQTLDGDSSASSVAFSPNGRIMASGWQTTIKLWDAESGKLLQILEEQNGGVNSVAFSPDGRRLASGSLDGTIKLWDTESGALQQTLEGHISRVKSIAFLPSEKKLASGSDDGTIKLWDLESGALYKTLEGHNGLRFSVAFSPDGRRAVASSDITLWDMKSDKLLQTLEQNDFIYTPYVAFSPDGRILASTYIKTIRLWDVESGTLLRTLGGHIGYVDCVVFSPDGRSLASGSDDATIKLWNAESGTLLQTFEGHTDSVKSVAISPDGRTLASGSGDHTIRLWDIESGALLQTLEGHISYVNSVAFSPDGKRLASGSSDGTIRLWEVESGALLQTLEGHTSSVNSIAFSPDGKKLASGSSDGTIRIWDISER